MKMLTTEEFCLCQDAYDNGDKLPQFSPYAYKLYRHLGLVSLFIFDVEGNIIKQGICNESDLYNLSLDNSRTPKTFEEILKVELYYTIRDCQEKYQRFETNELKTKPIKILEKLLEKFKYESVDEQLKNQLEYEINGFKYRLIQDSGLIDIGIEQIVLDYNIGETISIRCGNLFTACLLMGIYVPLEHTKYQRNDKFTCTNGDTVKYNPLDGSVVFEKFNNV